MKRIIVLALTVVLASVSAFASFGVKGIYFSPSDSDFKDIYGGGWMPGAELTFGLSNSLDGWISGAYFAKKGSLTYTQEETKLTLIPIGGGLRYRFMAGKVVPYVAGGVEYVLYNESNVIGDVSAGGLGFIGKVGVLISLGKGFGCDFHAGYSSCKLTPADFEINVGGIEFGAGIVF